MIKSRLVTGACVAATLLALAAPSSQAGGKGDPGAGSKLFTKLNCVLCHAEGGNLQNPEKPLVGSRFLKKYPADKTLESAIRKGFPREGMPAYGKDQLSDREMVDLIAYIRSLEPVKK